MTEQVLIKTQPAGLAPGMEALASAALRFEKYWIPVPFCGCWIWLGGMVGNGYGRFNFAPASNFAHRASWLIHKGPIPAGMFVCHSCDMPPCVNPDHLFLGTASDNLRDMIVKGRAGFQKNPETYRAVGRALAAGPDWYNRSKLTEYEVEIVRHLVSRGAFLVDIAKVFDVDLAIISNVVSGRSHRRPH